ncbi:MAG: hypothetical protein ACP5N2_03185 [Candidatus Nanoarchaeia archaeon]
MKYLAVDVAIIPPEEILDLCIEINKSLSDKSATYFELGKKDYLPHITLAMGSIKSEDLLKIKKIIKIISSNHRPLKIVVSELKSVVKSGAVWNSVMVIKKTKELVNLHKEIMDSISKLFMDEASPEMFISPPTVEEGASALRWVKEFHNTTVYDDYFPHISLSKGKILEDKMSKIKIPFSFTGSRLIISHLGIHCTCRKILFEIELK